MRVQLVAYFGNITITSYLSEKPGPNRSIARLRTISETFLFDLWKSTDMPARQRE